MRALIVCPLLVALALVAGCDKPSEAKSSVDITGGGKKAMERAQDVSKVLDAGAARSLEAADQQSKP